MTRHSHRIARTDITATGCTSPNVKAPDPSTAPPTRQWAPCLRRPAVTAIHRQAPENPPLSPLALTIAFYKSETAPSSLYPAASARAGEESGDGRRRGGGAARAASASFRRVASRASLASPAFRRRRRCGAARRASCVDSRN